MKRFSKVVEDVLFGKYGIEYKHDRNYYQVYFTHNWAKRCWSIVPCNKYITLFELLGILEYEYLYVSIKIRNCNCFSLCFNCYKNKDVQYALTEAKNIVVYEIERIQKGG